MTSLTDLTQPELDVMLHLVQSKTTNVVVLAADMWRTTPDWQAFDPFPLITYVLDSLSSRGLCTFRVRAPGENRAAFDMPFDIRLTPKGWELMGYEHKTVEVGSSGRHERESAHPGDMTDYVNLAGVTYGGPIETDTFADHRVFFPEHAHMYGVPLTMANQGGFTTRLAQPDIQQEGDGVTRSYLRVTPAMEAVVISAREGMGIVGYADIARETGIPERTVKYILTELPRLRRNKAGEGKANRSLKERVFDYVEAIGPIKDVPELRRILGMGDDEHSIMHVLHSLHTAGRVDFTERGNGMGTATLVDIRLPKKGGKRMDRETYDALPEIVQERLPEQLGPEATTDTPTPPSAPESDGEAYPLLDLILQRERARLDSDNKGMAYVTAAEAIQEIDPGTAADLMKKAEALNVPFPSPIEQEYLRYVAAHPKENE